MTSYPMAEAYTEHLQNLITDQDFEAEKEWEMKMFKRGKDRYQRAVDNLKKAHSEGTTNYGLALIKKNVDKIQQGIDAYLAKALSGGRGRRQTAAKLLDGMDTGTVAFLALRKLIDVMSNDKPILQNIALAVGNEVMFERKLHSLKEQDTERWSLTKRHLHNSQSRKYVSTVLNVAFSKSKLADFEVWAKNERIQLGIRLIEIISETTGLFDIVMERLGSMMYKKHADYYLVRPSKEVCSWVNNYVEYSCIISPDYYPTIIPPKPWTSISDGAYYFQHPDLRLKLLKVRDKGYLQDVDSLFCDGHLEDIKQAINALQNTAWTINQDIYKVATEIWSNGGGKAGLPTSDLISMPPCPFCGKDITRECSAYMNGKGQRHECFDHPAILKYKELKRTLNDTIAPTKEEDHAYHSLTSDEKEIVDRFKAWKVATHGVRDTVAEVDGQKRGVIATLAIASPLRMYKRFYFPYQLDFRGRLYTIPSFLTPQGTDLAKALLKFADAKPLRTEEAVKWLAIHVANCYGNSKLSLKQRYEWVKANENFIVSCAEDPFTEIGWMDADEPFCFLASCYEWVGYLENGLEFKSSLPVAMDGTCNGLQLFSLMLRDEIGGYATNLVPAPEYHDIYGVVAERVIVKLKDKDDDDAKLLLQLLIDRSTTKRQVMTLPYGATFNSCIEYTRVWMKKQTNIDFGFPGKTHLSTEDAKLAQKEFRRLSIVLAHYIWDSISETVVKARQAMDYLQKMVSLTNKLNEAVWWTTPCGLPVKQEYHDYKPLEIKTLLGDKVTKLISYDEPVGLDKVKQRNSISPNFIHSLDASGLMKTVSKCANDHSIHSFAMIHDSYGTHAADAPVLARVLRETFVEMFDDKDLLKNFEDELLMRYPKLQTEELPPRPEFGKLEVRAVKDSLYFFS